MSKELIERLRNEDLFTSLFGSLAALHECNEELKNEAAYAIESLTAERDRLREVLRSILHGTMLPGGCNRTGVGLALDISMGAFDGDKEIKRWALGLEKKIQAALEEGQ